MRHLLLTLTLVLSFTTAFAQAPSLINYQGLLTDAGGNPVADGNYSVTFTIYSAAVGGSSIWTETQNITTSDGLFAVLLGSVTPFPGNVFSGSRYLGIQVDADPEMTPRTALVSVPYALRVATVDGASGGNISGSISAGFFSNASGNWSVAFGNQNVASGDGSAVTGGADNVASGPGAVVCGGSGIIGTNNVAAGANSVVSGGRFNAANDLYSTVGGGQSNTASAQNATVSGGQDGIAAGLYSTVGGGRSNFAVGEYSTAPGGRSNEAGGNYSFAVGRNAKALFDGCFVWADSADTNFEATAPNQFLIRAGGGVGINRNDPLAPLHVTSTPGNGNNILYLQMERSWAFRQVSSGVNTSLELASLTAGPKDFIITPGNSGNVGINTTSPSQKLHVDGNICYTGTIGACSDIRYKKNIRTLDGSLGHLLRMRGVRYEWDKEAHPDREFSDGDQIGFVAQEVEELYPEMVMTDDEGYKSVDYSRLTPVLVEAIKEQQQQIDELKSMIEILTRDQNRGETAYSQRSDN